MATRAKKQQRRQRRQHRSAVLRKVPSDFQFDASMELEATADTAIAFEAAAEGDEKKLRTFSMTAYTGGKLQVRGFYYPVVVDLAGFRVSKKSRPMLRNHDPGRIVGHSTNIAVNAGSIRAEGVLSAANDEAREVAESADNGFPWQGSIGAAVEKAAYVDDGEKVTVNNRTFVGPVIVARQSVLREISFVPLGADDNTSARIAASAAENTLEIFAMEFTQWLEAKGFNADDLDDSQTASLKALFEAEQPDGDDPPKPKPKTKTVEATVSEPEGDELPDVEAQIKTRRDAEAAEIERIEAIRKICAEYDNPTQKIKGEDKSIEVMAIAEGWTKDRTELEALRESRPKSPAGHSRDHDKDCTVEAMAGAMILRCEGQLDHPAYKNSLQAIAVGIPGWLRAGVNDEQRQRYMELSHRYSDMSMVDLCAEAVRLDGKNVSGGRNAIIQAAVSGGSLSYVFTTSVNARLLMGFMEEPDTTGGWTQGRDVADFKQYESIRLQKGSGMAPHPRGGHADHWSRADQQETNKIARFSRQFFVDEQDFIDDAFDVFKSTPKEMGEAARRLIPDLVYAILLANPNLNATGRALFNATDANLDTGSALSADNLKVGVSEMMIVQENGVNLNLAPTHLLTAPARKHLAYELTNSSQILFGGDDETTRGNLNALKADNLIPVAEARLQNGVTHPGTGTTYAGASGDWFLANNRVPTIEVGFLRGTGRAPQTSTWKKTGEDGQWGVGYSAKFDVGAMPVEWRGMRKHEE